MLTSDGFRTRWVPVDTVFRDRCVYKQVALLLVDVDIGQAGAIVERIVSDWRDAGRNRNTGQAGAIVERIVFDFRDSFRNRNTGQAGAIVERKASD